MMFGYQSALTTTGVFLVLMVVPTLTQAQEPGDFQIRVTERQVECSADAVAVGLVGYTGLECNCTFAITRDGRAYYEFLAEPVIEGVEEGSPADGKLRAGDVIVAVDGYLIMTPEGGRRFGGVSPGTPVVFTVRRGRSELDVTLTPEQGCLEILRPPPPEALRDLDRMVDYFRESPARIPRPGAPPQRPAAAARPPAPPRPDVLPRGWIGFSINCSDCSAEIRPGRNFPVWRFASFPTLNRVDPESPAHDAGMRAGDVLTYLNRVPLTSEEGGRMFGAVQPGDTLSLRYVRNSRAHVATLVAATRPQVAVERALQPPSSPVTRFSGAVGDTHVHVTGGPVTVNRTDDEIVIQSQDITVRIRKTGERDEGRAH